MKYLTDTDLSRLVLFTKQKSIKLAVQDPDLETELAKSLLKDLKQCKASEGNEADYNRILNLAGLRNKVHFKFAADISEKTKIKFLEVLKEEVIKAGGTWTQD